MVPPLILIYSPVFLSATRFELPYASVVQTVQKVYIFCSDAWYNGNIFYIYYYLTGLADIEWLMMYGDFSYF